MEIFGWFWMMSFDVLFLIQWPGLREILMKGYDYMREDRVRLYNPLPSHSSLLPLSLPLSSLSLKLGFDLDFWSKDWWSFLEGNLGAFLLLFFLSLARQVYDYNLLSFLCNLMLRVC